MSWPWKELKNITEYTLLGGHRVLTRSGNGFKEHFWIRGSTLFCSVPGLSSLESVKVDRRVFNDVLPHITGVCFLDYKGRKKSYFTIPWLVQEHKKGNTRAEGNSLWLPIQDVQDYQPDKKYKDFTGRT